MKVLLSFILTAISITGFASDAKFDSSELSYDIKKINTHDRISSKFELKNIKYKGLKLSEDGVHTTANFICKNQLNGASLDVQGKISQVNKGTKLYEIDLYSEATNKVPDMYQLNAQAYQLTLDSIICIVQTYNSLDQFQE